MSGIGTDDPEPPDAARRLPRGRHGLSRATVVAAQRDRIMRALIDVMVESGYTATSVGAIIKRAGVSRETFYEQFRSKEDCFEQCFHWAMATADRMVRSVVAGYSGDPLRRLDQVLEAYLQDLADDPARAKVFLIDMFAAGPRFSLMRAERHMGFVGALAAIFDARTERQRFACQMLVAAISSMVTTTVAAGDFESLLGLREPLMTMVRSSRDLYGFAESPAPNPESGSD